MAGYIISIAIATTTAGAIASLAERAEVALAIFAR